MSEMKYSEENQSPTRGRDSDNFADLNAVNHQNVVLRPEEEEEDELYINTDRDQRREDMVEMGEPKVGFAIPHQHYSPEEDVNMHRKPWGMLRQEETDYEVQYERDHPYRAEEPNIYIHQHNTMPAKTSQLSKYYIYIYIIEVHIHSSK